MDTLGSISNISTSYNDILTNNLNKKTENDFRNILDNELALKSEDELKKACVEFETYFIHSMFKAMRKTINYEDGFIKRSQGEEFFQDFLDEEYSKKLAQNGGIGLGNMMFKNLSRNIVEME